MEEKVSLTTQHFTLIGAVHLFLMRDDKVLLSRRFNTGYEDGNYSVVAGHLDGNEEIRAAMIREARDEVGIELASADVQVVGVMHRKSNDERVDFFLAIERWSGELRNCEPDKCDDLSWFGLDSLPKNMVRMYVGRWRIIARDAGLIVLVFERKSRSLLCSENEDVACLFWSSISPSFISLWWKDTIKRPETAEDR